MKSVTICLCCVLSAGCAIPEVQLAVQTITSRVQSTVNEYCKKPKQLRLAYRAIFAEVTFPHEVRIECAKVE